MELATSASRRRVLRAWLYGVRQRRLGLNHDSIGRLLICGWPEASKAVDLSGSPASPSGPRSELTLQVASALHGLGDPPGHAGPGR